MNTRTRKFLSRMAFDSSKRIVEYRKELPDWYSKPSSGKWTYATKQRPVTHKWVAVSPNVASVLRELGFKVSGNSVLLEEDE